MLLELANLLYNSLLLTESKQYFCRAMVDHSIGKDLPSVSVESFEYFPGRGLTATVNCVEVQAIYLLIFI